MADRNVILDRIAGWLICCSCLRIGHTPIHITARLLGMCPGEGTWH